MLVQVQVQVKAILSSPPSLQESSSTLVRASRNAARAVQGLTPPSLAPSSVYASRDLLKLLVLAMVLLLVMGMVMATIVVTTATSVSAHCPLCPRWLLLLLLLLLLHLQ